MHQLSVDASSLPSKHMQQHSNPFPALLQRIPDIIPIDKLVELKNAHSKGKKNAGLNVYDGKIIDMLAEGVLEPLRSKRQSIQSASETAVMLIRVDDMMITQSKSPGQGSALPAYVK